MWLVSHLLSVVRYGWTTDDARNKSFQIWCLRRVWLGWASCSLFPNVKSIPPHEIFTCCGEKVAQMPLLAFFFSWIWVGLGLGTSSVS